LQIQNDVDAKAIYQMQQSSVLPRR
jgi:hypothetical protein